MRMDDVLLDDKAKKMRDLLSSFYSPDPSTTSDASSKHEISDSINTTSFDADQYMDFLVWFLFFSIRNLTLLVSYL